MAHRLPLTDDRRPRPDEDTSVGAVVDFVKTYAKQETVGPLRGAGRWLGFGALAAAALGLGLSLLMLGLLRLLQAEWERSARGSLSWLPYAIVFVVSAGLLVLTLTRINKSPLNKEPER